jgi:hypothetical protein
MVTGQVYRDREEHMRGNVKTKKQWNKKEEENTDTETETTTDENRSNSINL